MIGQIFPQPVPGSSSVVGGVNRQTGTGYTIMLTDSGKLISFANAAAIAVTLPNANTFPDHFFVDVENTGVGTLTITPTTSTVDGAATIALLTDQGVRVFSDGTNYWTERGKFASPTTTLGDIIYRGASADLRLPGNITATRKFLRQTGTGSVSAAPAWDVIAVADVTGAVPNTRQIINGNGITGGGDLSADRTLAVVANTTNQQVEIQKSGSSIGTRKTVNLIPGSNITLTVADDGGADRVDVTIDAAGSTGGGSSYQPFADPAFPNAADDEFRGGALDASWTLVSSAGATISFAPNYAPSYLSAAMAAGGAGNNYVFSKAFTPGASDYAVTYRMRAYLPNSFQQLSLCIADAAAGANLVPVAGNQIITTFQRDGTSPALYATKYVAGVITTSMVNRVGIQPDIWIHFQRKAGTYTYWYSIDQGVLYQPISLGGFTWPALTPAFLMIEIQTGGTAAFQVMLDFVRVDWFFL